VSKQFFFLLYLSWQVLVNSGISILLVPNLVYANDIHKYHTPTSITTKTQSNTILLSYTFRFVLLKTIGQITKVYGLKGLD